MEFTQRLRENHGLSDQSITLLMQETVREEYRAKQIVVCEGERNPYAYFIERGSARTYVMREQKCVIMLFRFEGDPVTPILGSSEASTARYTIETLEPTTLLRIPRVCLEALFNRNIELANWGRRSSELALSMHEEYFANYCWLDKGSQYELLLRQYPQLLNRVPLKDLAAYLMVTPQSLSRIRAEIK